MAVTGTGDGIRTTGSEVTADLRGLPRALLATLLVTVVPVAVVWVLRERGVIGSPVLGILAAVGLSLAAGLAGEEIWSRRPHADGAVFSELLLWGWLRGLRNDRRLAHADRLLAEIAAGRSKRGRERLVRQLAVAVDAHDTYLEGHSRRVARHATMIARQLGLPRDEVARIRAAAAVHDVGKLNVPLSILDKPGSLTDAEFAVIKRHPSDGEAIVSGLGDSALSSIVRHHHERIDGRGYPDGMAGEEIPLGARIVAVADTFDAITSVRVYRPAADHHRALEILREASGTQLDADVVEAFRRHYRGLGPIALWTTLSGWFARRAGRAGHGATSASLTTGKMVVLAAASAAVGLGGVAISGVSTTAAHAARTARVTPATTRRATASSGARASAAAATSTAPATGTRKATFVARATAAPRSRSGRRAHAGRVAAGGNAGVIAVRTHTRAVRAGTHARRGLKPAQAVGVTAQPTTGTTHPSTGTTHPTAGTTQPTTGTTQPTTGTTQPTVGPTQPAAGTRHYHYHHHRPAGPRWHSRGTPHGQRYPHPAPNSHGHPRSRHGGRW